MEAGIMGKVFKIEDGSRGTQVAGNLNLRRGKSNVDTGLICVAIGLLLFLIVQILSFRPGLEGHYRDVDEIKNANASAIKNSIAEQNNLWLQFFADRK
jgi:hypothetical protein